MRINLSLLSLNILLVIYGYAQKPTFPKPADIEDVQIFSLRLIVKTANTKDAGSNDKVYIKLYPDMAPFYLDRSTPDRKNNQINAYDIIDPNVKKISDIKDVTITKQGTDGWSFVSVMFQVNNCMLFKKDFVNQWIDSDNGARPDITFTGEEMRRAGKWNYKRANRFIYLFPRVVKKETIVKLIESVIGNGLGYSGNHILWGTTNGIKNTLWGDAVEASYRNSQTLDIDLDLALNVPLIHDDAIDVDIDLVISCNAGKVKVNNSRGSSWVPGIGIISQYLDRNFNVPNCTAHFEKDGDLVYY